MNNHPYGLRVVGGKWASRVLVAHDRAFRAYCLCDERANVEAEAYLSAFQFGPDFRRLFEAERSERGYGGSCAAEHAWFDIDRENDLEFALSETRRLAAGLLDRYRSLDEDDLLIFHSGSKGFHIGIPTCVFGANPSPSFNATCRRWAEAVADRAGVKIDTSIYSKVRLFRAPNSRHATSGRYKRRIEYDELIYMSIEAILDRSREPLAFDPPTAKGTVDPAGREDWKQASAVAEQKVAERRGRAASSSGLSAFARRFIRDSECDAERRAVSTFRVAAELAEYVEANGSDGLIHAIVSDAALDVGLTPSEAKRQVSCGIAHARSRAKGENAP